MSAVVVDANRRRDLVRMKAVATGLLVVVALVFVAARVLEVDRPWVGYIRATAEAAMVGALADWFAVTALFKHPLRLPIPHTAIIQKRKDQIGASLGSFVQDNFLTSEVVGKRLSDARLGARLGEWLAEPQNARTVGDQSAAVIGGLTEVIQDDIVSGGVEKIVTEKIRAIPVAPLVGKAVDVAVDGEYHQNLLESTLAGISSFMDDNRATFRGRLNQESPWWVPEPIDDRVFAKVYDVVGRFVADIESDRDHALRKELDAKAAELANRLKDSPEMKARGESLKEDLLAHPELRAWSASLWDRIKLGVMNETSNPDSELRVSLEQGLVDLGQRLTADVELQTKIDSWIVCSVSYVAEQFRGEVADLIASTVQKWDSEETAERLELQVGRDLQFIRINGTIVGGLAGLAIYTISELLVG